MPEILDDQASDSLNIGRILDIARRRHLHVVLALLVGWLLVWGGSWLLSPRYTSSTKILAQAPIVSSDYVQSNVGGSLQDRVSSITQQVLSRAQLLAIIDKLHLYGGPQGLASEDAAVETMRKTILVEPAHDAGSNSVSAFRVSFSAGSAKLAQAVTTELANLFVDENLRTQQEQSEGTTKFIESQLAQARTDLAAQEAKIGAFQSQHVGDLPTEQSGNLQMLGGLQAQLQSQQDALNTAKQQHVYLQTQIDLDKPTRTGQRSADPAVAAIDQELTQLRAQLADLSSRYTDKYPDVVRVKDQIAQTEQRRRNLIAGEKTGETADAADAGAGAQSPLFAQLQAQLHANQVEIANREHAISELDTRIAQYQGRVNGAPEVEQQLAELTRGYNQAQANYDDLLKKKNQSALATSMDQADQGARFTILDPPSLPAKPDSPNHLKFFGVGLVFGIGLGVAVAAAFEWLDDRLYDEAEIKALLPVPVIAEVPRVPVVSEQRHAMKMGVLRWAMTAVVLAAIAAGAAFSYLNA